MAWYKAKSYSNEIQNLSKRTLYVKRLILNNMYDFEKKIGLFFK